eukprot:TRINITY_DN36174_c0_g1_i1.p1 TRINITY_DN36174_c0_g1~~TRINITY_DN36174_c0_g1_i1.p1  ORF type:complete len:128 (+),score=55.68 TRINITY_DN36174_c0_g1_i1:31-414(+)
MMLGMSIFFFFQAEDGIRDAQESRGLGDVYKRQEYGAKAEEWRCAKQFWSAVSRSTATTATPPTPTPTTPSTPTSTPTSPSTSSATCLLYTSDAADEEDSVDLGGRRIIKKKKKKKQIEGMTMKKEE